MKIVAHTFGERAVLKLMHAALIRASESWRGIVIKPFEGKQLEAIRGGVARDRAHPGPEGVLRPIGVASLVDLEQDPLDDVFRVVGFQIRAATKARRRGSTERRSRS